MHGTLQTRGVKITIQDKGNHKGYLVSYQDKFGRLRRATKPTSSAAAAFAFTIIEMQQRGNHIGCHELFQGQEPSRQAPPANLPKEPWPARLKGGLLKLCAAF